MMILFLLLVSVCVATRISERHHSNEAEIERPLVATGQRNFTDGTEPHLKAIFMGRCYAVTDDPQSAAALVAFNGTIDCARLWRLFAGSFAFKVDANVTPDDFAPYFNDTQVKASLAATGRRALFWSGVQEFVSQVQESCHLFVMETSPLVAILDGLMFCASPTDPLGMNMTECEYGDVQNGQWKGTWVSFWAAASAAYAPTVTGNITLLFSGNKARPAYRRTSFFGSIELPLLNTDQITGATIYVASQRPDLPIYEPCGQGSMALLLQDLLKIGLDNSTITCINDPRVGERRAETAAWIFSDVSLSHHNHSSSHAVCHLLHVAGMRVCESVKKK
jgi:hypothetical protein